MKQLLNKNILLCLLLGFCSGTPLLLLGQTLKYWLKASDVSVELIGLVSSFAILYNLKFLWAPLLDNYSLVKGYRRKSWIILSQVSIAVGLLSLSFLNPQDITIFYAVVIFTIFWSATLDICIDACRREILEDAELGLGSTFNVYGYRIAMFLANFLPLAVAEQLSWNMAYQVMAYLVLLSGICIVFFLDEPRIITIKRHFISAVKQPLIEFFSRHSFEYSFLILGFITLYKFGDGLASQVTSIFYVDKGYSFGDIKNITSTFGFFSTFIGMFIGGVLIRYLGILKCLWIFGILQIISTIGFAILSHLPTDNLYFACVISFENISGGMGTSVFVAYISSLTNKEFSASQYALLSSLTTLIQNLVGGYSGVLLKLLGYFNYFSVCTLLGVPGMIILYFLLKAQQKSNHIVKA